ncbi:hypothetical protein QZH41_013600, partial [Actinostola sp. cb2023]
MSRGNADCVVFDTPNYGLVQANVTGVQQMFYYLNNYIHVQRYMPLMPVMPLPRPRNAWGDLSYADLITMAILSTPDKKMAMTDIYSWITRNIPYFSSKANTPAARGWK